MVLLVSSSTNFTNMTYAVTRRDLVPFEFAVVDALRPHKQTSSIIPKNPKIHNHKT